MISNLKKKSFLKLLDFSPSEIHFLLKLADDLKKAKYSATEQQRLKGKNIALINGYQRINEGYGKGVGQNVRCY